MSTKPCALMTQYIEGSIIGRELQDMLAQEVERERFDKALRAMDSERGIDWVDGTDYCDWMHERLATEGSL